jgi:hypothetical protein
MHVATKGELLPGEKQEHVAGPGAPKKPGTNLDAAVAGRDPLGAKDMSSTFATDKNPLQHTYRKTNPLSLEVKSFISSLDQLQQTPKNAILNESLNTVDHNNDNGTLLDEDQLNEI